MSDIVSVFVETVVQGLNDYFALAIPLFVLVWFVFRARLDHRKVQERQRADAAQWRREVTWSLVSQLVFGVTAVVVGVVVQVGLGGPLVDLSSWTSPVGVGALVLAGVLVDDAFFYWSHRALHTPRLYRRFHLTHHRSVDVNPLTSFSFHPVEAAVNAAPLTVAAALFGLHPTVIVLWGYLSLVNNLLGHLGFEWMPRWAQQSPVLRWKTPSSHHNLHHERVRGNYGLYFTFWDRIGGTEFSDYDDRRRAVLDRMDAATVASTRGACVAPPVEVDPDMAHGSRVRRWATEP
jgi:sterol desaturase/sphingolipid hydroxylase (fatty acid hydroxylase superfamily)